MKRADFVKKIQLIYVPFILSLIEICLGLTICYWVCIVQLKLFADPRLFLIISFILPILFVLIYLYPRLSLLDIDIRTKGMYLFIFVISAFVQTTWAYLIIDPVKLEQSSPTTILNFFVGFLVEFLLLFLMIIFPKLDSYELKKFEQGDDSYLNAWKTFSYFFIPQRDYFITPIILNSSIGVFVWMICSDITILLTDNNPLLGYAVTETTWVDGEWWKFFTSVFVYTDKIQFCINMICFVFLGTILEPFLGWFRFLIVYILTGITACIASTLFMSNVIHVSSSGAALGLYGLFLALLLTRVIVWQFNVLFKAVVIAFIAFHLICGLFVHHIDNVAHITGLVSGLMAGLILFPFLKEKSLFEEEHIDKNNAS